MRGSTCPRPTNANRTAGGAATCPKSRAAPVRGSTSHLPPSIETSIASVTKKTIDKLLSWTFFARSVTPATPASMPGTRAEATPARAATEQRGAEAGRRSSPRAIPETRSPVARDHSVAMPLTVSSPRWHLFEVATLPRPVKNRDPEQDRGPKRPSRRLGAREQPSGDAGHRPGSAKGRGPADRPGRRPSGRPPSSRPRPARSAGSLGRPAGQRLSLHVSRPGPLPPRSRRARTVLGGGVRPRPEPGRGRRRSVVGS